MIIPAAIRILLPHQATIMIFRGWCYCFLNVVHFSTEKAGLEMQLKEIRTKRRNLEHILDNGESLSEQYI